LSTLRDLSKYLLSQDFIENDQFEAEQVGESQLVQSMTEYDGVNQVYLLYREYYDGMIYIESWTHPKELLLSHIATWLIESGGERDRDELGFPLIEALTNDDKSVDLSIEIRFMEAVYIQRDCKGDMQIDGEHYRRVVPVPFFVEDVEARWA
jgi:hypothetical protein